VVEVIDLDGVVLCCAVHWVGDIVSFFLLLA
jgi:hypothetical protein